MLTPEQAIKPDAIEKHFYEPFMKLERHPMSDKITELFIKLCIAELINEQPEIPDDEMPFGIKLIIKRIEICFDYTMSMSAKLMLALVAPSPGLAVMYLTYLQGWCKKNGIKHIDLTLFGEEIFPWGFPSEDDLRELWDATKIQTEKESRNLVDFFPALQSLRF